MSPRVKAVRVFRDGAGHGEQETGESGSESDDEEDVLGGGTLRGDEDGDDDEEMVVRSSPAREGHAGATPPWAVAPGGSPLVPRLALGGTGIQVVQRVEGWGPLGLEIERIVSARSVQDGDSPGPPWQVERAGGDVDAGEVDEDELDARTRRFMRGLCLARVDADVVSGRARKLIGQKVAAEAKVARFEAVAREMQSVAVARQAESDALREANRDLQRQRMEQVERVAALEARGDSGPGANPGADEKAAGVNLDQLASEARTPAEQLVVVDRLRMELEGHRGRAELVVSQLRALSVEWDKVDGQGQWIQKIFDLTLDRTSTPQGEGEEAPSLRGARDSPTHAMELRRALLDAEGDLRATFAKNEELVVVLSEKENEISRLSALVHGWREERKELEAQIQAARGENATLEVLAHQGSERKALEARCRDAEMEAVAAEGRAQALELEKTTLRAELAEKSAQLEMTSRGHHAREEALKKVLALSEELDDTYSRIRGLVEHNALLRKQVDGLNGDLRGAAAREAGLAKEVQVVRSDAEQLRVQVEQMSVKQREAAVEEAGLRKEAVGARSEAEQLHAQVKQLQAQIEELLAKQRETVVEEAGLRKEAEGARSEAEQLRALVAQLKAEADQFRAEMQSAGDREQEASITRDAAASRCEEVENQLKRLAVDLKKSEELKAEAIASAADQADKLRNVLEKRDAELKTALDTLEAAEERDAETEAAEKEMEALKDELEVMRSDLAQQNVKLAAALQAKDDAVFARAKEIGEALADKDANIMRLEIQLTGALEETRTAEGALLRIRDEKNSLAEECSKLRDKAAAHARSAEESAARAKSLELECLGAKEQLSRAEERAEAAGPGAQARVDELQCVIEQMQASKERLELEETLARGELAELRQDLAAQKATVHRLTAELELSREPQRVSGKSTSKSSPKGKEGAIFASPARKATPSSLSPQQTSSAGIRGKENNASPSVRLGGNFVAKVVQQRTLDELESRRTENARLVAELGRATSRLDRLSAEVDAMQKVHVDRKAHQEVLDELEALRARAMISPRTHEGVAAQLTSARSCLAEFVRHEEDLTRRACAVEATLEDAQVRAAKMSALVEAAASLEGELDALRARTMVSPRTHEGVVAQLTSARACLEEIARRESDLSKKASAVEANLGSAQVRAAQIEALAQDASSLQVELEAQKAENARLVAELEGVRCMHAEQMDLILAEQAEVLRGGVADAQAASSALKSTAEDLCANLAAARSGNADGAGVHLSLMLKRQKALVWNKDRALQRALKRLEFVEAGGHARGSLWRPEGDETYAVPSPPCTPRNPRPRT